jgi:ATP synthase protein I
VLPTWGKPIRTTLCWQAIVTLIIAAVAGVLEGRHAAMSAGLGGLVALAAGAAFLGVGVFGRADSAGAALGVALKAEAAKLATIVVLLGLVLSLYRDVVVVALIGTFIAAVVIFSGAIFLVPARARANPDAS